MYIFTEDQLKDLQQCEKEYSFTKKYGNLHNVYLDNQTKVNTKVVAVIEDFYARKCTTYYFLKYVEGSYCKFHKDEGEYEFNACVTLLNKQDLQGGLTLTWEDACVDVRDLHVGESFFNKPGDVHGVSLIHGGLREVFVAWFKGM